MQSTLLLWESVLNKSVVILEYDESVSVRGKCWLTAFTCIAKLLLYSEINKMGGIIWALWILMTIWYSGVNCQSIEEAKTLHADLLKDYNKFVRPVRNQSKTVDVYFYFALVAIQDFDEVKEQFSVTGVFFLHWIDQNMKWNKEDYGNITSVMMGYKDVWVPEIILTNPSQKLDSFGKEWQVIRYLSYGFATWYPADLIKATCSLDLRYFPFDIQECSMELYIWAYTANEVRLISAREDIDTDVMRGEHGTWKLLNTSVKSEVSHNIYRATLTFRLKRKSLYVIVNIVLPILFLSILNVLVFILPAESGERVSYAITVLLAIAVFMTIITDTLPKKSEPLPLISYFLMVDLIVSALTSLLTILNLRIYHKEDDDIVPMWLQSVYRFLLRKNNKRRIYKSEGIENHENRAFEDDTSNKRPNSNSNGRKGNLEISTEEGNKVLWKDVSKLIDWFCLLVFSLVTFATLVVFLVITLFQR